MSIGYRLCSLSYKRWSFSQLLPEAAPGGSRPPGSEHSAAGAMPCSRRGTRRGTFWQWNWRWRCLSWAQIDGFTDYFRMTTVAKGKKTEHEQSRQGFGGLKMAGTWPMTKKKGASNIWNICCLDLSGSFMPHVWGPVARLHLFQAAEHVARHAPRSGCRNDLKWNHCISGQPGANSWHLMAWNNIHCHKKTTCQPL